MKRHKQVSNAREALREISTELHNEFWCMIATFSQPQARPDWHLGQAERLAELTKLIRKIDDAYAALWNDFTPEGETE